MGDDWTQCNIRVKESTYDEWKDVAESDYGTISELVRSAVRREIDGHHGTANTDQTPAGEETITEVAETVDRLQNSVNDMNQRLTVVRESVDGSGEVSLKDAVREAVPREDGLSESQIAARLDAKVSDVEEVVEELHDEQEIMEYWESSDQEDPYWTRWT